MRRLIAILLGCSLKVFKTTSWKDFFLQVIWSYLEKSEGWYFCNFLLLISGPWRDPLRHGFEQRMWVIYSNWLLLAATSLQSPLHLTRIKAQPFFHVDLLMTMFWELARNSIKRSGGFSKSKSVFLRLRLLYHKSINTSTKPGRLATILHPPFGRLRFDK